MNKFILVVLISAISFGCKKSTDPIPPPTVTPTWKQSSGTVGLNIQCLLSSGNYNYAGGATGAYMSTNKGESFTLSNTGNDAVGPTRGFAKDNSFVYTCTSQGVFRSDNNGASWVSKSNGLTSLLTSGIINVGANLFVVGVNGVFKSADQGGSWSVAGLQGTDVRCITALQNTLFVGTNGFGIYKSTDMGATWTSANNGSSSTNFRAMETRGTTLFAGGQIGTGVFRSTDAGQNWTLLSGGLPGGSYRGFAQNINIIVAGSFGGGVFYSKNNGDIWTALNDGLADLTIFDLEINDTNILAATNQGGVYKYALVDLK